MVSTTKGIDLSTDRLIGDLKSVINSGEDLLLATASQSGDKILEIRKRVESSLNDAREKLGEVQEEVVERAKDAAQATDSYVRDNPWTSVGIGAAAGFVVGVLISRR